MAKGPRYRVKLRRRREGRTDYYQRRELLKSGMTRLVIRRSTKNMTVQFIDAKVDGDVTLVGVRNRALEPFGWIINGGNIPAAYLTGYLAGKKAVKAGVEEAILDLGLQINTHKGRIYAALKGVIDAGVEVPANEVIFPDEEVLSGSQIAKIANAMKDEDKDEYKKRFAGYTEKKVDPTKLDKLVDKVKKAIDKEF